MIMDLIECVLVEDVGSEEGPYRRCEVLWWTHLAQLISRLRTLTYWVGPGFLGDEEAHTSNKGTFRSGLGYTTKGH